MAIRTKQEKKILQHELMDIEKKERKMLSYTPKEEGHLTTTDKIRRKIPKKAMDSLEVAFEKGFSLIFEKGDVVIEKTGSLSKARDEASGYHDSLDRLIHKKTLKAVDRAAGSRVLRSKAITTAEGTTLGIVGLGMPDIPIFIGMLLKTCYEIGTSYGFDYRKPEEKKFTLSVLKTAFSNEDEKIFFSRECDELASILDGGHEIETTLTPEEIKQVSSVLATDMLVAKFLQGMTFVGVIGGPLNFRLVHKVSRVAKVKYKKRFILKLINEN